MMIIPGTKNKTQNLNPRKNIFMNHSLKAAKSADKAIFMVIGGLTIVALVLIFAFAARGENKPARAVTTYTSADSEKPKVEVSNMSADLGLMSVKDEKSAQFTIKNTGTKPLQLSGVNTSCDCTFATVTIQGTTSQEFSMHAKTDWVGSVEPGENATLTVLYRPSVMPVKGAVSRATFVETNDPEKLLLRFDVAAVVK